MLKPKYEKKVEWLTSMSEVINERDSHMGLSNN